MVSYEEYPPIVFEPIGDHTATVIIIHGLGDSALTWSIPVESWRRSGNMDEVKFVLPNAPEIPITANMGTEMQAWFDINISGSCESVKDHEDVEGIMRSREYLQKLIQDEIDAGVDPERIIIGGFSQGGALSILTGLMSEQKLGGIVCLSAWLLRAEDWDELIPEENPNEETPILMGHGVDDRMVAPAMGKSSFDKLKSLGYDVSWEVYPGLGHSTCMEELEDVEAFIEERLGLA